MVYRDGDLPRVDRGIQYPGGVVARETDTLGTERVYAWAAKNGRGCCGWMKNPLVAVGLVLSGDSGHVFWVRWMGGRGGLGDGLLCGGD